MKCYNRIKIDRLLEGGEELMRKVFPDHFTITVFFLAGRVHGFLFRGFLPCLKRWPECQQGYRQDNAYYQCSYDRLFLHSWSGYVYWTSPSSEMLHQR